MKYAAAGQQRPQPDSKSFQLAGKWLWACPMSCHLDRVWSTHPLQLDTWHRVGLHQQPPDSCSSFLHLLLIGLMRPLGIMEEVGRSSQLVHHLRQAPLMTRDLY